MTDRPFSVSVIVPTFDRAPMIGSTLDSIAAQTYPDIELVVIDDGSTDNTHEVVERFARTSTRLVTYLQQDNFGCAAARNRGLRLATGEFVTFLDSDDVWLPSAVESLVKALVAADADFVYSPAIEVSLDGSERVNYPVAAHHPDIFAVEHFMRTNVRNGSFMFRSHVLSTVPALDESLRHNEDSDFLQRLSIHYKAAYCSSPTVKVYHHEKNKSRDRAAIYGALFKSAEKILEEYPTFRDRLGESATGRLRELRTGQVEALLIAGEFQEAREVAGASPQSVSRLVRVATRIRSTLPLEIRDRVNVWKRFARRRLSSGIKRA